VIRFLPLVFVTGIIACAAQPPAPQPSGAPAQPTVAPLPSASPSPAPTPVPTPVPSPSASPPPGPAYHFIYTPPPQAVRPPPDTPKILEIDFTDQTIHTNSDVALRILTTPSVTSVVLSAMGHDAAVPQIGPGIWSERMHVPSVPFFFLHTYNVQVRAVAPDGRQDSVSLPVRLVR